MSCGCMAGNDKCVRDECAFCCYCGAELPGGTDAIAFAKEFARRAHDRQRYGDEPYMYHLEQVVQLVAPLYRPSTAVYSDIDETARKRVMIMVIAYLHDVIEDTRIDYDSIETIFGGRIADAVKLLSDPKASNRKKRKQALYKQIEEVELALGDDAEAVELFCMAITVKVADRLANVVNSARSAQHGHLKMYQQEHPEFRRRLHREGACDDLWASLDYALRVTTAGEPKECV